ncbi:hypothetical protein CDAR_369571 [Caerostris darwini]|uniref:Uncharacterized protein n=1 Tax=Caerostris darwini TaxID=1538125 RepID=A0AAV4S0B7_9ARAC|nr:hypothetical protein CDAR_369571 [Caerostris darwini]
MHSIIHEKENSKVKMKKKRRLHWDKPKIWIREPPSHFFFLPERSLRFFGLTSVSGCHPSQDPRQEVPFAYPFYHLDRSLISRFISGMFFIDLPLFRIEIDSLVVVYLKELDDGANFGNL